MPRTISIDAVQLMHVHLIREADGTLRIYAEYNLKSKGEVVLPVYKEITAGLSGARATALVALADGIAQDIAAAELA